MCFLCFLNKTKIFFVNKTVSSSSFSVGLRFYYWPYYQTLKEIPAGDQLDWNEDDHSGFNVCELFVTPKYGTFQEEIANYKFISFTQYKEDIITKVNAYVDTDIVKGTKAGRVPCKYLHYGIESGRILGFENLVSLVLYTDYSELCKNFSSSFRKMKSYEPVESIKKRNAVYGWMSKILRETVELFGGCSRDETLSGPFYSGMGVVMNMPSFNIRLCSPTSTSCTIEVAIKFSGDHGIIIQLDNPGNVYPYYELRGFNCSWISRYKEEDERY